MSGQRLPRAASLTTATRPLSANEQAVIDRIPIPVLRAAFEKLWRVKVRLQFTGWLQYIPPALVALAILTIAGLAWLLGLTAVAGALALAGAALLALEAFDLVTVKGRVRPREPLPRRLDGLGAFDLMRVRRSCRSFQTRKLTAADRDELLASVRRHVAEGRIGTRAIRFEYVSEKLTVWPPVNASEFIVAIAPAEYDRVAIMDVGRSLQMIVADATRMGLGTCWIGQGADRASVARHLGDRLDPARDHVVCVCAVGYPSWFVPMFLRVFNARFSRRRLPIEKLFFADSAMQQPLDVAAPPFERFGRTFEICQWAPSSYNGQTTRCVAVTDASGLARLDFFQTIESRYYAPLAVGIWCANWEIGCDALGIPGRFAVLPEAERRGGGPGSAAVYDISWVPAQTP